MDKLEQYLDQVCRGMGGPRAMRQHVRQELCEHLRDAVSEHVAAGLSESDATERALADFGGPEEIKSELEATHGHRLLPVVIDKALDWKEKTMRAKWLWTSWAQIALVVVVVLQVLWMTFANIFLVPKFQRITLDAGWGPKFAEEPATSFALSFLQLLMWFGKHATFVLIGAIIMWGIFEWRVRNENKTLMRMSAFGTLAVCLMIGSILTAAAMLIPVFLGSLSLFQRNVP